MTCRLISFLSLAIAVLFASQPVFAQEISEDGNVASISKQQEQEEDSSDEEETLTLRDSAENNTTSLVNDSLVTDFSKMDPELLEDRLQCMQKDIPLTYFKPVHQIIKFYVVDRHQYTERMQARANYYFPIFEEYLAKYDLPEELKYLAVVESALNPTAVSRSGAVGLWQFMPMTGRELGLEINSTIDERRDVHKSTEAACKYLKRLYKYFGDWELALASYNCGPGYVRRAVRRSGYQKSYQGIYRYLPRETRAYVPSFVAVAYAFNYAEEHYLHVHPDSVLSMTNDTVQIDHYLDLIRFSEELDMDYEDLAYMNPALKVTYVPSHIGDYTLNIPQDKKECLNAFRKEIMDSSSIRNFERIEHVVRSGNSLGGISQYYGVSISDIKKWNGLSGNMIHPGERLVMWKANGSKVSAYREKAAKKKSTHSKSSNSSNKKKVYVVQPGDTLWSISKKKDTSVDQIMQLNNMKSKHLKPGQRLIVG